MKTASQTMVMVALIGLISACVEDSGLTFTLQLPTSAAINTHTPISIEIEEQSDEVLLYRFTSASSELHFKPNSGVVALKNKQDAKALVNVTYQAPQKPGKYLYTFTLTDAQGMVTKRIFEIQVN